jgi:phage-related baseplate assembly protein
VQTAEIVPYQIDAVLHLYPGPEAEPIQQAAEQKLQAYIATQHRLGRDIRLSAIYAALHVEGVQRVELASPAADIVIATSQAASCTGSCSSWITGLSKIRAWRRPCSKLAAVRWQ